MAYLFLDSRTNLGAGPSDCSASEAVNGKEEAQLGDPSLELNSRANVCYFIDFKTSNQEDIIGRIVIETFPQSAPKMCKTFFECMARSRGIYPGYDVGKVKRNQSNTSRK